MSLTIIGSGIIEYSRSNLTYTVLYWLSMLHILCDMITWQRLCVKLLVFHVSFT